MFLFLSAPLLFAQSLWSPNINTLDGSIFRSGSVGIGASSAPTATLLLQNTYPTVLIPDEPGTFSSPVLPFPILRFVSKPSPASSLFSDIVWDIRTSSSFDFVRGIKTNFSISEHLLSASARTFILKDRFSVGIMEDAANKSTYIGFNASYFGVGKFRFGVGVNKGGAVIESNESGALLFATKSSVTPIQTVSASVNARMYISSTGQIGIGTLLPKAPLQIQSSLTLNGQGAFVGIANNAFLDGITMKSIESGRPALINFLSDGGIGFGFSSTNLVANQNVNFVYPFKITSQNDGSVSIGGVDAKTKLNKSGEPYHLFVGGGILTQEVTVKLNEGAFPDYVFDEGYTLPTLDSISEFISKNKHLPGMPAGEEIEKQGMELSSIVLLQQQKIEELFLYILQLEQRLKAEEAK